MRGPKRGPSPRTRPRRRSIASSRSSSSRALERVRSSAAPLRKRGWSSIADRVGLAQARDRDQLDAVLGGEQLERALDLRPRVAEVRAEPDEASASWLRLSVIPRDRSYRVTRRAPQRTDRVVALCFSSAAQAAVLAHPEKPVTLRPAHLRRAAGLPRTLVELDHVRGSAAVPALQPCGRPADRAARSRSGACRAGPRSGCCRASSAAGSSAR